MASRAAIKFGPQLRELRLHLCQRSAASQGVRYCMTGSRKHQFIFKFNSPICALSVVLMSITSGIVYMPV